MARLIHFVIAVDLDDKSVSVDDDTYTARFSPSEQVWDTDLQEWVEYVVVDDETGDSEYDLAIEILNTKLLEEN
jgi:hypothetical protein